MDDLIGSVPVNSKSLDGIGSIGFVYNYNNYPGGTAGSASRLETADAPSLAGGPNVGSGGSFATGGASSTAGSSPTGGWSSTGGSGNPGPSFLPQCTGTLISKTSVLTSRSCAQLFEQTKYDNYVSIQFAIGSNPTQSTRRITVVDAEYAPVVDGGTSYPDIGVLHLGEAVTDVATFAVNVLNDDLIGKPFAAVGYGNSDLSYRYGTRRAGSLVLRGTSGLLYPMVFDSFDALYDYVLSTGNYPTPYGNDAPTPAAGGASSSGGSSGIAGGAFGGSFSSAGTGGAFQTAGAGNAFPTAGTGGGGNDWFRQYLQSIYDNTQLASGEAYFGGKESDAQPCGADQGGPMVRKAQGQVRVFGVFSHTPFGSCDKGGVYARITAETKAFIDSAAQWTDPCSGVNTFGKCIGTTATRCSTSTEGKRRLIEFDCSLLNQACVAPGCAEVACTDK